VHCSNVCTHAQVVSDQHGSRNERDDVPQQSNGPPVGPGARRLVAAPSGRYRPAKSFDTEEGMTTTQATKGRTDGEHTFWREHTTISLRPVAAPSILGLYGFAAATFIVAANLVGWYGNDTTTPLILFPFALAFGGIAQLLAGMWSYRARDGLATAMHGTWGSFWIGYGIYNLLIALNVLPGTTDPGAATAFGFWFVVLAAITWVMAVAASAENAGFTAVLVTLAVGSTLLAIGMIIGASFIEIIGAYFLIASAVLAWYTASAMMLEGTFKRVVLPVGKRDAPETPGEPGARSIQYSLGEPGVKIGQ